jgi:hypothetical protein
MWIYVLYVLALAATMTYRVGSIFGAGDPLDVYMARARYARYDRDYPYSDPEVLKMDPFPMERLLSYLQGRPSVQRAAAQRILYDRNQPEDMRAVIPILETWDSYERGDFLWPHSWWEAIEATAKTQPQTSDQAIELAKRCLLETADESSEIDEATGSEWKTK